MPSIQARFFLAMMKLPIMKLPFDEPIETMRQAAQKAPSTWMPRGVNLERVSAAGVPSEWLVPDNAEAGFAILYLHGGGYCLSTPRLHRPMLARLALAARARVLMIDYRLAPENPFPAGLHDTLSAWRWLVSEGYRPNRIVVAGDSSGAGLALALAFVLNDAHEELPAAIVGLSSWLDLAASEETLRARRRTEPIGMAERLRKMALIYAAGHDLQDPQISPVYAKLSGLPPLLLQVGDNEIMLGDAKRLAEQARAAGVDVTLDVWPGMFHIWHMLAPILPEANQAIDRIANFVRARWEASI